MNRVIRMMIFALAVVTLCSASFAEVLTDKLDKGIVGVNFSDASGKIYRVLIVKGNDSQNKVSYPFFANGKTEYFPLTQGNGDYTVSLLLNQGGNKYSYVEQKGVTLNLADPSVVYLNSVQNIKWSSDDEAIKYAMTLSKDQNTAKAAFDMFYKYMTEKVIYDFNKASSVKSDYVPSISKTFVDSKGICYDYSSMLAAFMRSRGFATRLVKGYTTNVEGYHAWNEVLIDGQWMIVDTTLDAGMKKFDVQFKPSDQYRKVHEY